MNTSLVETANAKRGSSHSTKWRVLDRAATGAILSISGLVALFAASMLYLTSPPGGDRRTEAVVLSEAAGLAMIYASLATGIAIGMWRLAGKRTAWWMALLSIPAIILSAYIGFFAIGISTRMTP